MKNKHLQELLKLSFKAEQKYFEATERVQVVEFSRFLNYQSTKRNNYCNKLIEAFVANGITPEITYIEKHNRVAVGMELSKLLANTNYPSIVNSCLKFDLKLINKCNEVLAIPSLPDNIKQVITRGVIFLTLSELKSIALIENYNSKKTTSFNNAKFIPLQKRAV